MREKTVNEYFNYMIINCHFYTFSQFLPYLIDSVAYRNHIKHISKKSIDRTTFFFF